MVPSQPSHISYKAKISLTLGFLQLILAVVLMTANSVVIGVVRKAHFRRNQVELDIGFASYIGSCYWCGIIFIVGGVVGLVAAKTKSTCPVRNYISVS